MTRNILLTSLDALTGDRGLRYYAARGEFGGSIENIEIIRKDSEAKE